MEYFLDAFRDDLDADAEREECDHFIDYHRARDPYFLRDFLSLRQDDVQDQTHQEDDERDDRIVYDDLSQAVLDIDRRHQGENDGYAAGSDADRKGDRVKYPGFQVAYADRVDGLVRRAACRSIRIAEPLQGRFTDQKTSSQLNDRQRQSEQGQYEVPDRQAADPDQQVVDGNPPDDGSSLRTVQSRQAVK